MSLWNNAQNIQISLRGTRRSVSYEYRGSSSLTPGQIMEREGYTAWIYYLFDHILDHQQVMVYFQSTYDRLRSFVHDHSGRLDLGRLVAEAREMMTSVEASYEELKVTVNCYMGLAEIAFLYVEDLSVFIRRRVRFTVIRNRTIDEIPIDDCYNWFGQNHSNLHLLALHLRVPPTFRTATGVLFTGEECFLIYLYHAIKGSPFTEMARFVFGGDPRRLSEANSLFIEHAYNKFYHKISGKSLQQWLPSHLHLCRRLIYDDVMRGAIQEITTENGQEVNREYIHLQFDPDTFRIFAFLDDFGMPTARPGDSVRRRRGFIDNIQRAFFSGYFHKHGLKAQVVFLPIGLIGSVYIAELRQNDTGVLNMSGLDSYLVRIFTRFNCLVGGLFPCVYCDGIFPETNTVCPRHVRPNEDQGLQNLLFAPQRQCIEHVFCDHRTRFKWFGMPHQIRLFNSGVQVRRECLISFLILNCYYCLDGTRAGYFRHIPPTLQEYLPLEEDLEPPPAVELGDTYDYWYPDDDDEEMG